MKIGFVTGDETQPEPDNSRRASAVIRRRLTPGRYVLVSADVVPLRVTAGRLGFVSDWRIPTPV
jgi:hypothetical protein